MLASLLLWFSLFRLHSLLPTSHCLQEAPPQLPNQCNDKCGSFHTIPFPFHLNTSCAHHSLLPNSSFHLSCFNSSSLFLTVASESYQILQFLSDGVLVDFPNTSSSSSSSSCRRYNDLNSFGMLSSSHEQYYFSISADNVIGLYDCEDSSLCKADCETIDLPSCDGHGTESPACCYPLSDHTVWHLGDGFSGFSKFGCRGFSCWNVPRGSNSGIRGVKLEWALPRNSSKLVCAKNAHVVNATTVKDGVRCSCQDGLVGDGFADGIGCLKSCIKDGREVYGNDCRAKGHNDKDVVILAGVLAPVLVVASLIALFCLMKRPAKAGTFDPNQAHYHSTISFRKACRTRLFTYYELEEATKGFEEGQKLVQGTNSTTYAGVLGDGSHVAVQKVQCDNERDLIQVLSGIEALSAILHRNMARLLGCCIDSGYTPLAVYEYPANGTLEEHLHQKRGQNLGLDWYKRLKICAETASVLAFLQCEISPPIFHRDLKSSCIFLDEEFSVKVSGFGLVSSGLGDTCRPNSGPRFQKSGDVYDLGLVILEMITGSKPVDAPQMLQKIGSGKLEEIVDPVLYYHEQPGFRREQIEIVADLATRCLLFGGDGKLGMVNVAKELVQITKLSMDGGSRRGPALEETFSNSSLLQMISLSPDSIYVA